MATSPSSMDHCLILLLLLHIIHISFAQTFGPTSSEDSINSGFTTTTASIFAALLAIFVLIAFVSVYFNRCIYGRTVSQYPTNRPSTNNITTTRSEDLERNNPLGLDQSVLETFPIMDYSAVKGLNMIKGPLECAVCLSEFANEESLRLLPECCHVFHPDCIDKWLETHITCPVCRADLSKPAMSTTQHTCVTPESDVENEEQTTDGHIANVDNQLGTNESERFTLRLPDHVRREIEDARRHRRSVSIAGYAYDRRGSGRISGRFWGIFRSFSSRWRNEGEIGEGSFKRVFPVIEDNRSIGIGFGSGESQSDAHAASEMVVFDPV